MSNKIVYQVQNKPNLKELERLFVAAFSQSPDSDKFTPETDQILKEWLDLKELKKYLPYGTLIEARCQKQLVGAVFIAKQNPITWPDGRKAEGFILAVLPKFRNRGIGKRLIKMQEIEAKKFGAKKIVINTHVLLKANQKLFQRMGYKKIGILKDYYDNGDAVFFSKDL
ncbi:MAG: N-acetyltransferase [Patescibacteria group bacterium]